ncbi:ecto-ADP-ribosyltransferase 3-like [Pelodytes ibericus]
MVGAIFAVVVLLLGVYQISGDNQNLPLHPDAFDDQYIHCAEELERERMPILLREEKERNPRFHAAWDKAEQRWRIVKNTRKIPCEALIPEEYSIAVTLCTMEDPEAHLIYAEFNANVSTAGASRKEYMENFHFKALHYYLVKGLQAYSTKFKDKHHIVTEQPIPDTAAMVFRFGNFLKIPAQPGNIPAAIATGHRMYRSDVFHECNATEAVQFIIPVSEAFLYIGKKEEYHFIISSGLKCSYFNCAYLGGEKQNTPVCNPASSPLSVSYSHTMPHTFSGFILVINAAFAKLVWT